MQYRNSLTVNMKNNEISNTVNVAKNDLVNLVNAARNEWNDWQFSVSSALASRYAKYDPSTTLTLTISDLNREVSL